MQSGCCPCPYPVTASLPKHLSFQPNISLLLSQLNFGCDLYQKVTNNATTKISHSTTSSVSYLFRKKAELGISIINLSYSDSNQYPFHQLSHSNHLPTTHRLPRQLPPQNGKKHILVMRQRLRRPTSMVLMRLDC
jgi:hypothetical protein